MGAASDNTLDILIKLGFIGADQADSARAAIGGVKKETGDLSQSLPEGSALFEKYKNVIGQTGGASLTTRQATSALHAALRGMGADIPGIGALMHGIFNPITIGLVGGIGGIEAYFGWLKKTEEKYHDLITLAQKVNADVQDIVKSGASADEKFVAFNKAIATAHENSRGLANSLAEDAKFANAMRESMDASADRLAQMHKDATEITFKTITLLEATGAVTPQQADSMKTAQAHAAKMQEFEDARAKTAGEVAAKQAEVNQARKDIAKAGGNDEGSIARAETNKQYSDDREQRLGATILGYQKFKEDMKAAFDAATAAAASHGIDSGEYKKAFDLATSLSDQAQKQKEIYDKANADYPGAVSAKVRDDKAFNDIVASIGALKGLTEELDKLKQKLAELDAAQAGPISTENQAYGMEQTVKRVKGGESVNEIFKEGAEAIALINQKTGAWGESVDQIHTAGAAARFRKENLPTGQALNQNDQRDIDRDKFITEQQQHVEALRELYQAMNFNSEAILGSLNASVGALRTSADIATASKQYIDSIHAELKVRLAALETAK
jgi:hypothetical protein